MYVYIFWVGSTSRKFIKYLRGNRMTFNIIFFSNVHTIEYKIVLILGSRVSDFDPKCAYLEQKWTY
jgi:hypothetical protein